MGILPFCNSVLYGIGGCINVPIGFLSSLDKMDRRRCRGEEAGWFSRTIDLICNMVTQTLDLFIDCIVGIVYLFHRIRDGNKATEL
jgi:hypothetical protein